MRKLLSILCIFSFSTNAYCAGDVSIYSSIIFYLTFITPIISFFYILGRINKLFTNILFYICIAIPYIYIIYYYSTHDIGIYTSIKIPLTYITAILIIPFIIFFISRKKTLINLKILFAYNVYLIMLFILFIIYIKETSEILFFFIWFGIAVLIPIRFLLKGLQK